MLTAPNVYQSHGNRVISILGLGEEIRDVSARLPLLIRATHDELTNGVDHYFFWFFGYVTKLPFEREVPDDAGILGQPTQLLNHDKRT